MKYKYSVEGDLGLDDSDERGWRSYDAYGQGNTLMEFFDDLTISEIDEDGGTLRSYDITRAPSKVEKAVFALLEASEDEIEAALEVIYEQEAARARARRAKFSS